VLLEERQRPIAQIEQLDLEPAVSLRAFHDPRHNAVSGAGWARASYDHLQLRHQWLLEIGVPWG
jgi:hypothetical protein